MTPDHVVGAAVWYAPGVMEATAQVRGLSLAGYEGGVSALSCANIGLDYWLKFPEENEWRGPFLVVDCAQQNDIYGTLVHRGEVVELGWRTAVAIADGPPPWRFDGVEVSKIDPRFLGENQPVELRSWYLERVTFASERTDRPIYRAPSTWRLDGEWVTFVQPEPNMSLGNEKPLAQLQGVVYPEAEFGVPVNGKAKHREEGTKMDLEQLFTEFWGAYGNQVTTILLLIVADVLIGTLAAWKAGSFEWERIGDFYQTKVIPYVGSYVILALLFGFGDRDILGMAGLGDAVVAAAQGLIYLTLGGSILGNLGAIGLPQPVENFLTSIGARPTPQEKGAPGT